jgi:hypothetical protein
MPPKTLNWISQFGDADAAVWVSVAKLDASWQRDTPHYVGPGCENSSSGSVQKYDKFGEFLRSNRDVWMPQVNLNNEGYAAFKDGRHRFAWLRDHGVNALPIATDPAEAKEIDRLFGTAERRSRVRT